MALITATHLGVRSGTYRVDIDRRVTNGGEILPAGVFASGKLDTDAEQPSVSVTVPDMGGAEFAVRVTVALYGGPTEVYTVPFPTADLDLATVTLPQDFAEPPTGVSLADYATVAYVDEQVGAGGGGGTVDLTGYATETYADQAATDAAAAIVVPDSPDDIGAAPVVHTHAAAQVIDLREAVEDFVGAMLVSGGSVTIDYDDETGKATISATGTDAESVRDTIGAALIGTQGVTVAINDAADTITLGISGLTIGQVGGLQAALDGKASTTELTTHTTSTTNPHSVTKAQVGLGNVDNTSDANKPISTATQAALDGKLAAFTIHALGQAVRPGFAVGQGGGTGLTLTSGSAYVRPLVIGTGGAISGVRLTITSAAAGAVLRVAIYEHDRTTKLPGSLVVNFGTVDASTTGAKLLSTPGTLADGMVYWVMIVAQGGNVAVSATQEPHPLLPALDPPNNTASSLTRDITGAPPASLGGSTYGLNGKSPSFAIVS